MPLISSSAREVGYKYTTPTVFLTHAHPASNKDIILFLFGQNNSIRLVLALTRRHKLFDVTRWDREGSVLPYRHKCHP